MMTPLSHLLPPLPFLPLQQTYAARLVWWGSNHCPNLLLSDAEEGRRPPLAPRSAPANYAAEV
jgi:hypothetical protein